MKNWFVIEVAIIVIEVSVVVVVCSDVYDDKKLQ